MVKARAGAVATLAWVRMVVVLLTLELVVADSTFIVNDSMGVGVGSTLIAVGSTLVAAGCGLVALVLCELASFLATISCVGVSDLLVVSSLASFIVFSSSSGMTRPKLHYIKSTCYNLQ